MRIVKPQNQKNKKFIERMTKGTVLFVISPFSSYYHLISQLLLPSQLTASPVKGKPFGA